MGQTHYSKDKQETLKNQGSFQEKKNKIILISFHMQNT